jgi:hypothetical protein
MVYVRQEYANYGIGVCAFSLSPRAADLGHTLALALCFYIDGTRSVSFCRLRVIDWDGIFEFRAHPRKAEILGSRSVQNK